MSPERVLALFKRQRGRCPWCGGELTFVPKNFNAEHIIPRSHGGGKKTLALAHIECNSRRSSDIHINPVAGYEFNWIRDILEQARKRDTCPDLWIDRGKRG